MSAGNRRRVHPNYASLSPILQVDQRLVNRLVQHSREAQPREKGFTDRNHSQYVITTPITSLAQLRNTFVDTSKVFHGYAYKLYADIQLLLSRRDGTAEQFYLQLRPDGLFHHPRSILSAEDMEDLLNSYVNSNYIGNLDLNSASNTMVVGVTWVRLTLDRIAIRLRDGHVDLPDVFREGSVDNFSRYYPNQCMIYALYVSTQTLPAGTDKRWLHKPMKTFAAECARILGLPSTQFEKGVDVVFQLPKLEQAFRVACTIYELEEPYENKQGTIVRRSPFEGDRRFKQVNFIQYENHVMPFDRDAFFKEYVCCHCKTPFARERDLVRHGSSCAETLKTFKKSKTEAQLHYRNFTFQMNQKYGTHIPIEYPYFGGLDYETMPLPLDANEQHDKKTRYVARHIPISISIGPSQAIQDASELRTRCFTLLDNGFPTQEPGDMFYDRIMKMNMEACLYLRTIALTATSLSLKQFQPLLDELEKRIRRHQMACYQLKVRQKDLRLSDKQVQKKVTMHVHAINRLEKDKRAIHRYCTTLPVFGFNSGKYDLQIGKYYGLFHSLLLNPDKVKIISAGNCLKLFETPEFKFMDLMLFQAPGLSLAKLQQSVLGRVDKLTIPYEYITTFSKLMTPVEELTVQDFHSELKQSTPREQEEHYTLFRKMCQKHQCRTLLDALRVYNNADIDPMLAIIDKQAKMYLPFNICMVRDVFSLASLSTRTKMEMTVYSKIDALVAPVRALPVTMNALAKFPPPPRRYKTLITRSIKEDNLRGFQVDRDYVTPEVIAMWLTQRSTCVYCLTPLTSETLSLDRLDNSLPHTVSNCVLACAACHRDRQDQSPDVFAWKQAKKRWLDINPIPCMFDESNKHLYDDFKTNTTGGLSSVFHRFHSVEFGSLAATSLITKTHDETGWSYTETDHPVLAIAGEDAANLYGMTQSIKMPCGQLEQDKTWTDAKMWAYLLRPVEQGWYHLSDERQPMFVKVKRWWVPTHLKTKFAQFPPCISHKVITYDMLTPEQQDLVDPSYTASKTVASMSMDDRLIDIRWARWLVWHGVRFEGVEYVVTAIPRACYQEFIDFCTNERRQADITGDKPREQNAKNLACSSYGTLMMNQDKYTRTFPSYNVEDSEEKVNAPTFRKREVIEFSDRDLFIITMAHKRKTQTVPVHCGNCVLDCAKVRVLEFIYDFLFYFWDPSLFNLMKTDTDSIYFAIGSKDPAIQAAFKAIFDNKAVQSKPEDEMTPDELDAYRKEVKRCVKERELAFMRLLDSMVRPDLVEEYCEVRNTFFPSIENYTYDQRTPGLFKLENLGSAMFAVCAKTDLLTLPDERMGVVEPELSYPDSKVTAKGIQHGRNADKLTDTAYYNAIFYNLPTTGRNVGFKVCRGGHQTYHQEKTAISAFYDKMQVVDQVVCFPHD